jgi:hypothetical protein
MGKTMNVLFVSNNFHPTVLSIILLYDIAVESHRYICILRCISNRVSSNQIKNREYGPDWRSRIFITVKITETKHPHASIPNIILSLEPKSPDTSSHKHPNNNTKIKNPQPQPYPKATKPRAPCAPPRRRPDPAPVPQIQPFQKGSRCTRAQKEMT